MFTTGTEGVADFLRQYMEIFYESECGRWTLCAGVVVPRCREAATSQSEDYSVHDTPPGQKVQSFPADFLSTLNNIYVANCLTKTSSIR